VVAHYQQYKEIPEKDYGIGEGIIVGIKIKLFVIQIAK
jgi:hypothetical protein